MLWPVEVLDNSGQVYCHSDKAVFHVEASKLISLKRGKTCNTYMEKGLRLLGKKPLTKKAFIEDLEWIKEKAWSNSRCCTSIPAASQSKRSPPTHMTGEDSLDDDDTSIPAASQSKGSPPTHMTGEDSLDDDDTSIPAASQSKGSPPTHMTGEDSLDDDDTSIPAASQSEGSPPTHMTGEDSLDDDDTSIPAASQSKGSPPTHMTGEDSLDDDDTSIPAASQSKGSPPTHMTGEDSLDDDDTSIPAASQSKGSPPTHMTREDSLDDDDTSIPAASQSYKSPPTHMTGKDSLDDSSGQSYVPETDSDSSESSDNNLNSETIDESSGKENVDAFSSNGFDEPDSGCDSEWDSDLVSSQVAKDVNNDKIYVTVVTKNFTGISGRLKKSDRTYDARHNCLFCNKSKTNFSHHILSNLHKDEKLVKELHGCLPKERRRKIMILRLKGDHNHNTAVLKKGKGEIILSRRFQSGEFDVSKYGPCPSCLGWMMHSTLKVHQKNCPARSKTSTQHRKSSLLVQSDILTGRIDKSASTSLIKEVFPIMQNDYVGKTAKSDELIIILGNQWMKRNIGNAIMRKYYTSSVKRLSARLKIFLCDATHEKDSTMEHFLQPKYYQQIVEAALHCGKNNDEDLQAPSNSIKLGFDLKRMTSAKLAMAIVAGNKEKKQEAEELLLLFNLNWGLDVTKQARVQLSQRVFNAKKDLPLPEDVKKLACYLTSELSEIDTSDWSFRNFRRIAHLVVARLTLYNRRRCHEAQALEIEAYHRRKRGVDEIAVEMMRELTPFERELLNRQEVVEIRGKTGKAVPLIIPSDVKEGLQYLTNQEVRKTACIVSKKYVFANSQGGVFRAYDAIRTVTEEAGLLKPNLVRTTNMRKYMATMLQSLDTTETERQWVISHLGHTMNVHAIHYRQTSDLLERVDVAKLLLIQDNGLVSKFAGKKLSDIQLENILPAENVPEETIQRENTCDDNFIPDLPVEEEDDEDIQLKKRGPKKVTTRVRWTEQEDKEIRLLFKRNLMNKTCPGYKEIVSKMNWSRKNKGLIHLRPKDNIKKKVSAMIVKIRNRDNAK